MTHLEHPRCWHKTNQIFTVKNYHSPFKDEAQTALFKDPVRTAL
jgi:hypothetical protein